MDIGVPQSRVEASIVRKELAAREDFEKTRTNPRVYGSLFVSLQSLIHLHAWAGSEVERVRWALRMLLSVYPELVAVVGQRPDGDRSEASSCETTRVISGAWILSDDDAPARLAPAIWDPPNASYVGPRSEICRPDQQQFAYSVREYVLGDNDKALELCRQVKPLKADVAAWTTIFNGILQGTGTRIPGALRTMLIAHEREARRKKHPFNVEYGVCLEALGLVALALRNGLVSRDQLPESQFLPYHWIVVE